MTVSEFTHNHSWFIVMAFASSLCYKRQRTNFIKTSWLASKLINSVMISKQKEEHHYVLYI